MIGMAKMKRPNLTSYFKARIDYKVNGMMARTQESRPRDVKSIVGDVTDSIITVTMLDGTVYKWSGGRYASRKVNLCYAPLMPRPVKEEMQRDTSVSHPMHCQTCGYKGTVRWHKEDDETWLADCPDCDRTHAANFKE